MALPRLCFDWRDLFESLTSFLLRASYFEVSVTKIYHSNLTVSRGENGNFESAFFYEAIIYRTIAPAAIL
ncbi:MAG TPA: hypothetical protein DCL49_11830 [Candidatus Omnitrophica bacterium]|nr:hypothetical protein [Candidatus Omnitrophota bacterium]